MQGNEWIRKHLHTVINKKSKLPNMYTVPFLFKSKNVCIEMHREKLGNKQQTGLALMHTTFQQGGRSGG